MIMEAGIFKQQGNLNLDDVVISNCQAVKSASVGFGGGITNYSGLLTITNSTLSNNTANNMGGGLYNYFNAGLSMTNVVVDHNQALTDAGGGLAIRGPSTGQTALPVSLDKVSLTNNSAGDSAGGLYTDDSLTITNSLIAGNTALGMSGAGGILFNDTGTGDLPLTASLTNTTITGNISPNSGGGIYFALVQAASSVTLNNVTIANNLGSGSGMGIYQYGNSLIYLENSIIAGNLSGPTLADCYGAFVSLDYNLIQTTTGCTISGATAHNISGVSPQLAALASNGGPTQTMALLPASPAIDAGNDASCAPADQRGITRPQGPHCDMGAFEYQFSTYWIYLPLVLR